MKSAFLTAAITLFATPAFAVPPYARHVCPNGLEVLVVERHSAPLVTVEIAAHNGAMTEPPDFNGLSHLYEHMFFKGNKVLPDQAAYLVRSRELGMILHGKTHIERVNYYITTTPDHFADTMTFMRDAITSPLFDAKELDRERVVVTGEMDRNESAPEFDFWRAVNRRVFWKYPSRRDPVGDRKTVLATTPEQMRTIQTRYYVPNNSILVVAGDVKPDDVFAKADALYAGWAKAPDPFLRFPLVRHPPIRRSEVVVVQKPVQTFTGTFEWQGPSTGDVTVSDSYAADLVGALLDDHASKFQKSLVDSGTCVHAELHWSTQPNLGEIDLSFESTEANVDACVSAIRAELPKIRGADYFTDAEMTNAAHGIDIALASKRETTQGVTNLLTKFWAHSSLDYYGTYVARLSAVTRADITKYLDGYVLNKPFVFGAMVSPTLATSIGRPHLEALVGIPRGGK